MEKRFCKICGNEILIQEITPTKTFRIKDDEFIREDNNSAFFDMGYNTFIQFVCSYDTQHIIVSNKTDIVSWMKYIEDEFNKRK